MQLLFAWHNVAEDVVLKPNIVWCSMTVSGKLVLFFDVLRTDEKCLNVQVGEDMPTCISLVARRRNVPRVGEEVSISYGDKSNEELLLLYGAASDCSNSLPTPHLVCNR